MHCLLKVKTGKLRTYPFFSYSGNFPSVTTVRLIKDLPMFSAWIDSAHWVW